MMEDYPTTLDRNLWFCPMATKTIDEGGQNPYMAWSEYDYVNGVLTYLVGSYGINLWISNEPWDVHEYWKSPNVRNTGYAPLLMDAQHNNLEPLAEDEPPPFETYLWTGGPADEIRRACIRRHHPFHINVLFLDYSMKRITLKELWILRWYVDWPQVARPPSRLAGLDGGYPGALIELPPVNTRISAGSSGPACCPGLF